MKKALKILVFSILTVGLPFLICQVVLAAYDYTPMQAIPGTSINSSKDFPNYVIAIYRFFIWTVGIAALFMVSIGGFMYFGAAGNTSRLEKAKTVITDALLGVIMVLTAWLLLNTINPDLTTIDLQSLESMKTETQ